MLVLLCAGHAQAQRRFYADIQLQKVDKKSEKARYKIKRRKKNGLYVVKAFRKDNGSLAITGSFRDKALKVKQGVFVYYSLATKRRVMHYDNNQAHGVYEKYDKQGQLQTKGQFVKGKQTGVFYTYTQGKLSQEANYNQGVLEGTCKQYKDGVLVAQGKYQQGKRMGWWTVRESGKNLRIKYFKGIALGAAKPRKNLYAIATILKGNKRLMGVINQRGKWVIRPTYYVHNVIGTPLYMVDADKGKEGLVHVRKGVILPSIYTDVGYPSNGRVRVKKGGKYGYFDYEGKQVIPFKYDKALGFKNGVTQVTLGNKHYEIDLHGKVLKTLKTEPISIDTEMPHQSSDFNNPIINAEGATIKYERTKSKDGLQGIRIRQLERKFSVSAGRVVTRTIALHQWIPEEYTYIRFVNGMFDIRKDDLFGVMNDRWEVVVKLGAMGVDDFWEK